MHDRHTELRKKRVCKSIDEKYEKTITNIEVAIFEI